MINRKAVYTYLVIAFSLAWVLFLLPLAFGAVESLTRRTITLLAWSAAMWAPGIAAIVANRKVDRAPLSQLGIIHIGDPRAYLWAWLVPPLLAIATGLLTWLLGAGQPDFALTALRQAITQAPGGEQVSPEMVVALQVSLGLTLGPLFNSLFALGEELGWRAYLLPKLMPLGAGRAILVSGIIWGVWHWPAILQGHNYPGHPYLGMLLMVVFCVLFGAFLSWLYLRTGSAWAPALGHGSLNAVAGLPLLFIPQVDLAIGGSPASLIGWIPLLALVGWLVWRRDLLRASLPVRFTSDTVNEI